MVLFPRARGRLVRVEGVSTLRVQSPLFGGSSKSACAVKVRVDADGDPVWVVSLHLSFQADERLAHLAALGEALGPTAPVIVAGDFNAPPSKLTEIDLPWFRGLTRAESDLATGLSGDFQRAVVIDHIFHRGLGENVPTVMREKAPIPPYRQATARAGRGTIVSGSDHIWLDAAFFPSVAERLSPSAAEVAQAESTATNGNPEPSYVRRARSLYEIYQSRFRPPQWALDWATSGAYEEAAREARVFTLDERSELVEEVVKRREPVNIGMSRHFDRAAMHSAFGYDTAGYETLFARSMASGQPELPPNIAVFCRTPVEGPAGGLVDVINVTGFAFDDQRQVDYRYFIAGGRQAELRDRLRDVFRLVFACARYRDRNTVVLSLVGSGAFVSLFDGGSVVYKNSYLFPAIAEAWRELGPRTRPARIGLMGNPSANDQERVASACDGADFFSCGYVPGILAEWPDALFVNAWDPSSIVGNGNAADNSLDGFFGRNTAMQFLTFPATNPFLQIMDAEAVRALLD